MSEICPIERAESSLIDLAVESWRFSRLFGKVVSKLDAGESGRYVNQVRYFQKKVEESLESNGLKLLEPIIMGPKGLRKQGTVMLRKVEA